MRGELWDRGLYVEVVSRAMHSTGQLSLCLVIHFRFRFCINLELYLHITLYVTVYNMSFIGYPKNPKSGTAALVGGTRSPFFPPAGF